MKIAQVEARPVRVERNREKAVGSAGSPTHVAGEGRYRWSSVFPALYPVDFETALIKITLADGRYGWGEAQAPLAPEVPCKIVELLLAPVLVGEDFDGSAERIAELWQRMYSTMRVRGQTGGFMLDAISGIDIALWDLAGKMQRLPVSTLIAGSAARTEVPAYLSGLAPGCDPGPFSTVKLFFDTSREAFLDRLRALRPARCIAVDALWRLTPEDAPEFARVLDDIGALWLEAPLAPEDAVAHGELARKIRTPLALGESYRTLYELAPFFRERAMGFVQPDLGRSGITEGLRIAHEAKERGVAVVPHLSIAMGPQIAAAIHFAAALPDCPMLEYNPNVFEIANRYLETPLEFRSTNYIVPNRPGLGCQVSL